MTRSGQRALAVAVRCGRLGAVLVDDGDLIIWDTSGKGASSVPSALETLHGWIEEFRPDILVTENPDSAGRKLGRQLRILRAFQAAGQEQDILNLVIRRERKFDNAYDEAADFAETFPDIAPLLPMKPPIWGKEPYGLIYFEALALIRDAGLLRHRPADFEL
ncbi:hypothetical protein [Primorskyibacter sp. 2E233]|uniref:hypothetical protein n=1 Tax=Primorskyibacter sp. 2E233 TaxID=3413431 RepID=UPI003BF28B39